MRARWPVRHPHSRPLEIKIVEKLSAQLLFHCGASYQIPICLSRRQNPFEQFPLFFVVGRAPPSASKAGTDADRFPRLRQEKNFFFCRRPVWLLTQQFSGGESCESLFFSLNGKIPVNLKVIELVAPSLR